MVLRGRPTIIRFLTKIPLYLCGHHTLALITKCVVLVIRCTHEVGWWLSYYSYGTLGAQFQRMGSSLASPNRRQVTLYGRAQFLNHYVDFMFLLVCGHQRGSVV